MRRQVGRRSRICQPDGFLRHRLISIRRRTTPTPLRCKSGQAALARYFPAESSVPIRRARPRILRTQSLNCSRRSRKFQRGAPANSTIASGRAKPPRGESVKGVSQICATTVPLQKTSDGGLSFGAGFFKEGKLSVVALRGAESETILESD